MKFKYTPLIFSFFLLFCSSNEPVYPKSELSTKLFGKTIPAHPRLLFSEEEEMLVKQLSKTDPLLNNLLQLLKSQADELLYAPTITPPNNLNNSREHVHCIITLSVAYRMFDEDKYARGVEKLLINICLYPGRNPDHYLDVAETTTAVAIGYDWLYNFLSGDTKILIEEAIVEKALNLSIPEYERL